MESTSRFGLPLLFTGQAQKEITHNEALLRLDALIIPSLTGSAGGPPGTPDEGDAWLIAEPSTGAWAQQSGKIATWHAGGWTFLQPQAGYMAWNKATGSHIVFDGSAWRLGVWPVRSVEVEGKQVVGSRQPSVSLPAGGAVVDMEARATLSALLVAVRAHGLIEPT